MCHSCGLEAARALGGAGRLNEAQPLIEEARSFFESVSATAYLREADEILAAAT